MVGRRRARGRERAALFGRREGCVGVGRGGATRRRRERARDARVLRGVPIAIDGKEYFSREETHRTEGCRERRRTSGPAWSSRPRPRPTRPWVRGHGPASYPGCRAGGEAWWRCKACRVLAREDNGSLTTEKMRLTRLGWTFGRRFQTPPRCFLLTDPHTISRPVGGPNQTEYPFFSGRRRVRKEMCVFQRRRGGVKGIFEPRLELYSRC